MSHFEAEAKLHSLIHASTMLLPTDLDTEIPEEALRLSGEAMRLGMKLREEREFALAQ